MIMAAMIECRCSALETTDENWQRLGVESQYRPANQSRELTVQERGHASKSFSVIANGLSSVQCAVCSRQLATRLRSIPRDSLILIVSPLARHSLLWTVSGR